MPEDAKLKLSPPSPAPAGSAVALPNDTKIRFCNALDALRRHIQESGCGHCPMYVEFGDGDLCEKGKEIIAMEMAYADTSIVFPQNETGQARRE